MIFDFRPSCVVALCINTVFSGHHFTAELCFSSKTRSVAVMSVDISFIRVLLRLPSPKLLCFAVDLFAAVDF